MVVVLSRLAQHADHLLREQLSFSRYMVLRRLVQLEILHYLDCPFRKETDHQNACDYLAVVPVMDLPEAFVCYSVSVEVEMVRWPDLLAGCCLHYELSPYPVDPPRIESQAGSSLLIPGRSQRPILR